MNPTLARELNRRVATNYNQGEEQTVNTPKAELPRVRFQGQELLRIKTGENASILVAPHYVDENGDPTMEANFIMVTGANPGDFFSVKQGQVRPFPWTGSPTMGSEDEIETVEAAEAATV